MKGISQNCTLPTLLFVLSIMSVIVMYISPSLALANGFRTQRIVIQEQLGPYFVTVLVSPYPIMAGSVAHMDIGVTEISYAQSFSEIDIIVTVIPPEGRGELNPVGPIAITQDRSLETVSVNIPISTDGEWLFKLDIVGERGQINTQFPLTAISAGIPWSSISAGVLGLLVLGLMAWVIRPTKK